MPTTTISATIDLDAEPDRVWAVLTATQDFPDWNPFLRRLEGPLTLGGTLTVRIELPGRKGMTFTPEVTALDPGRRLAWLGHFVVPGLFDGAHSFTLEPLGDGRTRFVQSESFSGVLVWFSRRAVKDTEAGFHAMNAALQQRLTAAVR